MTPPSKFRERAELEARRSRLRFEQRRRQTFWLGIAGASMLVFLAGVLLTRDSGPRRTTGDSRLADAIRSVREGQPPKVELPRGGRRLFPRFRIVAFDGVPGNPALGPIGRMGAEEAASRLEEQASAYETDDRELLPALHLIAVVAQADAGDDELYRQRLEDSVIEEYLDVARRHDMLLLLDIQPGHADFIDEVEELESFLREPDVGIALDSEWHLADGETPGTDLGSVEAQEVNEVAEYMQEIAAEEDLPEKLLLIHQFDASMVTDRDEITELPRVAIAFSIDGFGSPEVKRGVYGRLAPRDGQRSAFKLFYEEDSPLMSPDQVLDLRPRPQVILYE
jgi:hypothetical protein